MVEEKNKNPEIVLLIRNCMIYAVSWTIICVVATVWNVMNLTDNSINLAKKDAEEIIDQNRAIYYWTADHGGIYVANDKNKQSESDSDKTKDNSTQTGKNGGMRLINPAEILRQIEQYSPTPYKIYTHLTSKNVLNPANAPEDWEVEALKQFAAGGLQEISTITLIDKREHLRLSKPLTTKAGCLKCHAAAGFTEGAVESSISVAIPIAPYEKIEANSLHSLCYTHLFFWGAGLLIISLSFYRNKRRLMKRLADESLLLEQSEKIQLFAFSVAHDLKNPIIAIHALARIINNRHTEELDERTREYCGQIEKSAEQVSTLIEQINAFISSKEQPLQIEALSLAEVLEAIRMENETKLKARQIHYVTQLNVDLIQADRLVIMRILRNLIDNALKYGGEKLSKIVITSETTQSHHTIKVSNDGNAIAPADCRKIFQKFKRRCSDNTVEGAGLGLAIVRELVALNGGQVWAESDGVHGVTLSFTIMKR